MHSLDTVDLKVHIQRHTRALAGGQCLNLLYPTVLVPDHCRLKIKKTI
jgi:hypothetical protein